MHLTNIVAATDDSDAGRQAVRAAIEVAGRVGACVTVLRVVPSGENGTHPDLEHLQRWVESDLPPLDSAAPITYAVAQGLPGIEIVRFAERSRASLLVLGRKPRSRIVRLLLGDTADAVARRSGVPCLFVSPQGTRPRRLLVAVDGSVRGMTVLDTADRFARQVGADLLVLTVEPAHVGEPAHLALAGGRGEPEDRVPRHRHVAVERYGADRLHVLSSAVPDECDEPREVATLHVAREGGVHSRQPCAREATALDAR